MAILQFASGGATTTMHPHTPSFTTDDVFTNNAASITAHNVASSTMDATDDVAELFLQTRGAKAIAGVFAFASIVVTCIQVSYSLASRHFISPSG